jgi:hypothetical protein
MGTWVAAKCWRTISNKITRIKPKRICLSTYFIRLITARNMQHVKLLPLFGW